MHAYPLRVFAAPHRQEILRLVWRRERSAGEIAARFPVSFSAVSQHLRALRDAGVVGVRKDGKLRLYHARPEALGPFAAAFESMWGKCLVRLKRVAEREEKRGRKR